MVETFTDRRVRNCNGEHKRTNTCQRSLGVGAGVVGSVNGRIGAKGTHCEHRGGRPTIDQVSCVLSKSHAEDGQDRQQAGLGRNRRVGQGHLRQVTLDHEDQAYRARFNGLMATDRQPKLMFPHFSSW